MMRQARAAFARKRNAAVKQGLLALAAHTLVLLSKSRVVAYHAIDLHAVHQALRGLEHNVAHFTVSHKNGLDARDAIPKKNATQLWTFS